jgi:hypothetical protein
MKDALEEALMLSDRWGPCIISLPKCLRKLLSYRVIQDMVGQVTENIGVFYKASEAVGLRLDITMLVLLSLSLDICPRPSLGFRPCFYRFALTLLYDMCRECLTPPCSQRTITVSDKLLMKWK